MMEIIHSIKSSFNWNIPSQRKSHTLNASIIDSVGNSNVTHSVNKYWRNLSVIFVILFRA